MNMHEGKSTTYISSIEVDYYLWIYDKIWSYIIDVPRPLTNDLWVFLFQTIDAECVIWAIPAGTYVYFKAFIVNVNEICS